MTAPPGPPAARELLTAFASGTTSPVETVQDTLARIDRSHPQVHGFLAVDPDGALAAAREAQTRWGAWRRQRRGTPTTDGGWQRLPTWGLATSVKDSIEQAGMPTTYGSLAFADNHQPDAAVVRRLREAGCSLLGKTNTSEFALSTITANRLGPPTRNPWDASRTAGGSSGGAAAAAALGLGSFAVGTDSAGSIRLPAAYCGVYGLKPTFGTIPVRQRWRASPVRSHLGPLARSLDDLVYAWRVLARDDVPLAPLDVRPRIGLVEGDPDHRGVLDEAVAMLRSHAELTGAPTRLPALPPATSEDGDWIYSGDHLAAAEQLRPDFWERHGADLTAYARPIYDAGRRVPAWEYRRALEGFERYGDMAQALFDGADVLVTSTTEAAPVVADEDDPGDLGPRFPLLSVWNFTGNPALVVPLPPGADGLPRAVQLVGARGADRLLLSLALTLARAGAIDAPRHPAAALPVP